jgi:membrane protease YdiL (CAAX protease family)
LDFRQYAAFISEWMGVIAVAWILSRNPRFQKSPVGFKYSRREGFVSLSLSLMVIVFSYVYYTRIEPPIYPDPLHLVPAPAHSLNQAVVVAGLSLTAFLLALFIRKQPFRSAGWHPQLIRTGFQTGIAMALLTIFLRNRAMDVLGWMTGPELGLLPIALGISFAEETIFRGYIQMRLAWWMGVWPGIIASSAIFTLFHLTVWINTQPIETILILSALTFAQGMVLGWLMRSGGTVAGLGLYRGVSIWISTLG